MRKSAANQKALPQDEWITLPFEGKTLSINLRAIPSVILQQGLPFEIDPEKIWNLKRPSSRLLRARLDWMLGVPFWPKGQELFVVKPSEVLRNPDLHPVHAKKIEDADLIFPIDVVWYKKRWLILDGLHRLAKAKSANKNDIRVRKHKLSELKEHASCGSLHKGAIYEPNN